LDAFPTSPVTVVDEGN